MEERVQEILQECLQRRGVPPRELPYFAATSRQNADTTTQNLARPLFTEPQPVQKTAEWYALRQQLLTATAIASLFGSAAKCNEVIYEKCLQTPEARRPLSLQDARHWGVKYEPVTRRIYECLNRTRVKEYGCLQHPEYSFVGASPDGINVCAKSRKYGRLIEIKNVVSREITGVPLDDYWIQMQVQMEVCNIDLCDFVETRIREFESADAFFAERDKYDYCGVVLRFFDLTTQEAKYEYSPLLRGGHFWDARQIAAWKRRRTVAADTQLAVTIQYWYLDEYSCVVVPRNRLWFAAALPRIRRVWSTIEEERVQGDWMKRAPQRRPRATTDTSWTVLHKMEQTLQ
jgi:putative phage-type endonuclease